MDPLRPNATLRCESRQPSSFGLGLWKYALAVVIVAAAAIDAMWLVPTADDDRGPPASSYHDAMRGACR